MRGCLTVLFAFLAVFCIGAVLTADPCDRDGGAGVVFLLAGLLFAGVAAFGVGRGATQRPWIRWAVAVSVPLALACGSYLTLVIRWAEQCSR
jgi:hypothetical protein